MKLIKVIDDFIPKEYQDKIEDVMLGSSFNWFVAKTPEYDEGTLNIKYDKNTQDGFQFCHSFLTNTGEINSDKLPILDPLLWALTYKENLSISNIMRIKANLTTKETDFPTG